MARENEFFVTSLIAGADLSSSQQCAVAVNSSGQAILPATLGNQCAGINVNNPKSGQSCSVQVLGTAKMVTNSTGVAKGDKVTADTAGKAQTAASGNYVLGIALEAGTAGTIVTVLLLPGGKV